MASNPQNEVVSVISRNIKPGHEKDYDDWLQRYLTLERNAPGYIGATIIIPGGNSSALRYIIIRFTDKSSMKAWENSPESLKLLEKVSNYSTRYYEAVKKKGGKMSSLLLHYFYGPVIVLPPCFFSWPDAN